MNKARCGCGNPRGEHELVCRSCWLEVPGPVKQQLSHSSSRVTSELARRQILVFAFKRGELQSAAHSHAQ